MNGEKLCSVDSCSRKAKARGFCKKHYQEKYRSGELKKLECPIRKCAVPGCSEKYYSSGYCQKHGEKFRYYGDPLFEVEKISTLTDEERAELEKQRNLLSPEWRREVCIAHDHRCFVCSSAEKPRAHHIFSYTQYPHLGAEVSNGLLLCERHHIGFHKFCGGTVKGSTYADIFKWLTEELGMDPEFVNAHWERLGLLKVPELTFLVF